jgi:uncharacterized membrane protein YeiH
VLIGAAASEIVQVPLWLDLLAVFAGAVLGAAFAVRRGFDIAGVFALSMVTGFGGGVVRDVLLNQLPVALQRNAYVLTALVAATIGFFFARHIERLEQPLVALDALTLAVYAIVGVSKALSNGIAVVPAIIVGVVAAVSGAVIRDVLVAQTPEIFKPGTLYATPALLGCAVFAALHGLSAPLEASAPISIAVVFTVRLAAYWFSVTAPSPIDAAALVRERARRHRAD